MANKVLITDAIAPVCAELLSENGIESDVHLKKTPAELKEIVAEYDGWIIRSGTRITPELIEAAENLKVIGRAGVGVDNVDLDAATKKGVLVLNAPDGNTISTAEHTCAMLMAVARQIPNANQSLSGGEWNRKAFGGSEVYGKTLGVVGFGKIGREVASRMKAFGMDILAFDPVLSSDMAERLEIEKVELHDLFKRSDFITLHTPLNEHTRGLLNSETLGMCKPGVRLVNCARGGIINETDLLAALESGQVGGAALDVYSQEPPDESLLALLQHPAAVVTPHIAASTEEAQEKVARQVTHEVINALKGETVMTPVNSVAIKMAASPEAQPFLKLADKLGQFGSQIVEGDLRQIVVRAYGAGVQKYIEILTIAAIKGVLTNRTYQPVNYVNARALAEDAGLSVSQEKHAKEVNYLNLLEIELVASEGSVLVGGTTFGPEDVRIVRVDDYDLEVIPEGPMILYENEDRPGVIASVGGKLSDADINIGALALGRKGRGLLALTVISVDEEVPQAILDDMLSVDGVVKVRYIKI